MALRRRDFAYIGCGLFAAGAVGALRVEAWTRRLTDSSWLPPGAEGDGDSKSAEPDDVDGSGTAGSTATSAPPQSPRSRSRRALREGEGLVDGAIRVAMDEGLGFLDARGAPQGLSASALDALRLPNGAPLTPSMRRWLAFDARALGWFDDLAKPVFRRQDVLAFAQSTFEASAASSFEGLAKGAMPGRCLGVPLGDESRRFVYLSRPDATGEYPVMVIDIDDMPFVCVGYAGLDVYLATHAGLVHAPKEYGGSRSDPRFADRMKHHDNVVLGGRESIAMYQAGFLGPSRR